MINMEYHQHPHDITNIQSVSTTSEDITNVDVAKRAYIVINLYEIHR